MRSRGGRRRNVENNVQHLKLVRKNENLTEINRDKKYTAIKVKMATLRDKVGKGIKKKKHGKNSHRTSHYGRAQDC